MTNKSVALTGVSSFTGMWIAVTLKQAGYSVAGLCTESSIERYQGLRLRRLQYAKSAGVNLHFGVRVENSGMKQWILKNPCDVWIHHHHFMQDYRLPTYDLTRATQMTIVPLPEICNALKMVGCSHLIYSGTQFEEGTTPYGKSKADVWAAIQQECSARDLRLSKVVIPNPIGPAENEDRLIPVLIRKSKMGEPIHVGAPTATTYSVPISLLSDEYLKVVALKPPAGQIFKPSLGAVENLAFIRFVLAELVEKRLGFKPCKVETPSTDGPLESSTTTVAVKGTAENVNLPDEFLSYDWAAFWDFYRDGMNLF